MSRAECRGQLGGIAFERFLEARSAKRPGPELLGHLNDAIRGYQEELDVTPSDALGQLAVVHGRLGHLCREVGQVDSALRHYRESISLYESQGDLYGAARQRGNVAVTLARAGRYQMPANTRMLPYAVSMPSALAPLRTSRTRSP